MCAFACLAEEGTAYLPQCMFDLLSSKLCYERHVEWWFVQWNLLLDVLSHVYMSRWMDCASLWQMSGCVGLLSASLPKLFDVVCRLCAGDVTMTDE